MFSKANSAAVGFQAAVDKIQRIGTAAGTDHVGILPTCAGLSTAIHTHAAIVFHTTSTASIPCPGAIIGTMRLLFICAALGTAAFPQALEDELKARIAKFPGTVSLFAKNLETGASVGIREGEPVRTASTIKLPIMLAVFDAVERGQAKWEERLKISKADKVSGSGVLGTEISDGVELPLRDVVHLMIVLSDNTATNMIIERFTADAVNAYLDTIGLKTTRSMRKVRGDGTDLAKASGYSAAGKLPENQKYGLGVSTPRDMVSILERLEAGKIVSAEGSKQMLAILKRCHDNTGIRRRLPGVTVANKTGALDALRSDVGIVYAKNARIALAITVDGMEKPLWTPDNPGSILIGELAEIIVTRLSSADPRSTALRRVLGEVNASEVHKIQ